MNQLQRKQIQMNQLKRNSPQGIQLFVKSAIILDEIRWVLNLFLSKYLMNWSYNSGDLFSVMFSVVVLRNSFNVDVPRLVILPILVNTLFS